MTDDRGARGRRVLGHRRLSASLLAATALFMAGGWVGAASGQSGGAGASTAPGGLTTPSGPARPTTPTTPTTPTPPTAPPASSPFSARGMWIWYVSMSDGGSLSSIIAKAHRYGVKTLMIKSSDGSSSWSQFTPQLLARLHAAGLRVCAWQYVYGSFPGAEAQAGARAVSRGADCLLIDAESEYEGRYVQAQRYLSTLRKTIGARFPVALASFPYVDYHPAFPYSVFLGPGGAQFNVPQMYWQDIGVSVDTVYAHTYLFNRLYTRPIYPLGQVYNAPPARQIVRFRQLSLAYNAGGVSWWDWQEASGASWRAVAQPLASLAGFTAGTGLARLDRGMLGDLVVWAQEHLVKAGQRIPVDGTFGARTQRAVRRFQAANGLGATGAITASTWQVLLHYAPAAVHWTPHSARSASAAGAEGYLPVPKSASLPAVRDELRGAPGRGGLPFRH